MVLRKEGLGAATCDGNRGAASFGDALRGKEQGWRAGVCFGSSGLPRELLSVARWNLFQRTDGARIVRKLSYDPVQVCLEEIESWQVSDMQLGRVRPLGRVSAQAHATEPQLCRRGSPGSNARQCRSGSADGEDRTRTGSCVVTCAERTGWRAI